ncbi:MAG: hypothetical protein CMI16_04840 [Opitutaceae bacterium]|nr:hypothetical protein [Opitutaceae bacterium]
MSIRRAERSLTGLWSNAMDQLPPQRAHAGRHSPPLPIRCEEPRGEPPRLQPSRCSCFLTCVCCFVVLSALMGAGSLVLASGARLPWRAAKAPPAMLQRFALVQRAELPGHGADPESLRKVFPHWARGESLALDEAVRDLALAVADLSRELESPNGRLRPNG